MGRLFKENIIITFYNLLTLHNIYRKDIKLVRHGRSTTAIFLGLYNIKNHISNKDLTKTLHTIIDKNLFPDNWNKVISWYVLQLNPIFVDLSERLIIDWGNSTVWSVQNKDKIILEIKGEKQKTH